MTGKALAGTFGCITAKAPWVSRPAASLGVLLPLDAAEAEKVPLNLNEVILAQGSRLMQRKTVGWADRVVFESAAGQFVRFLPNLT